MRALIVLSLQDAKELVARGVATTLNLKNTKKKVYIAYGSTNELLLHELGYKVEGYYNGHVSKKELRSYSQRADIVVLNGSIDSFVQDMSSDDIVVKGANALSYENGAYQAGVVAASENGGTFGSVVMKASCVGAQLIIPVSHEKFVPKLYDGVYTQSSFDRCMGLPVAMFRFHYGKIYTEIEALYDIYNLKAKLYFAGGLGEMQGALSFVVEGKEEDVLKVIQDYDG